MHISWRCVGIMTRRPLYAYRTWRGPAVDGRAAKGTFVVIPLTFGDCDESTDHAVVDVARDHHTCVTGLERPLDGIVALLVVGREDHVITHAEEMLHRPRIKDKKLNRMINESTMNVSFALAILRSSPTALWSCDRILQGKEIYCSIVVVRL